MNRKRSLLILVAVLSSVVRIPGPDPAVAAPGGKILGRVEWVSGQVTVTRGASTIRVEQHKPVTVYLADEIETGAVSEAVVRSGKQVYVLKAGTRLALDEDRQEGTGFVASVVRLVKGVATFLIPKSKEPRFRVVSGTVVAAVRGTIFSVACSADRTPVKVEVLKGQVDVQDTPVTKKTVAPSVNHAPSTGLASPEPARAPLTVAAGEVAWLGNDEERKVDLDEPPPPMGPMAPMASPAGPADGGGTVSMVDHHDSVESRLSELQARLSKLPSGTVAVEDYY